MFSRLVGKIALLCKLGNRNGKKNNCMDISSDKPHEKTWIWLKKGNLKRETESLLTATQNKAITTNSVKARIDKTQHLTRENLDMTTKGKP